MNLVVHLLEQATGPGESGKWLLAPPVLLGIFGRLRMCTAMAASPSGKWSLRTCTVVFVVLSGISIAVAAIGAAGLYALVVPGSGFVAAGKRLEELFFPALLARADFAPQEIAGPIVQLTLIALVSIWGAGAVWVAERLIARMQHLWNEIPHGGGAFLGEPRVQFLDDGRKIQVMEDYSFRDSRGHLWTTPAGTIVDGASIPRFFWQSFGPPFCGRYRNASIIHDFYCQARCGRPSEVHRMFYEACLAEGLPPRKARLAYWAVRRFGPHWEDESGRLTHPDSDAGGNRLRQLAEVTEPAGHWSSGRQAA